MREHGPAPAFNPSCQLDGLQLSHSSPAGLECVAPCRGHTTTAPQKSCATPGSRPQAWYDSKPKDPKTRWSSLTRHSAHVFKLSSAVARNFSLWFQNNFLITHSRRTGVTKIQHCKFWLRKQLYCHSLTKCLHACGTCSVCSVLCLSHTACHWDIRTQVWRWSGF